MTKRFFKDLKEDELLNFSVAVVVMKVRAAVLDREKKKPRRVGAAG